MRFDVVAVAGAVDDERVASVGTGWVWPPMIVAVVVDDHGAVPVSSSTYFAVAFAVDFEYCEVIDGVPRPTAAIDSASATTHDAASAMGCPI